MAAFDGKALEATKTYKVAGWAPVGEERAAQATEPVWETVARYMRARSIIKPRKLNLPELRGVQGNPGIG